MTILIVDDQAMIVRGIEQAIPWEKIGILKVWKAYNALEAKRIIENEDIDILLCDIEMPEENGLSLCRWVSQNGYEIECIILTAHADFEFAKQAIALGIFDYILQPARYEEILETLLKVKERINTKRQMKKFSELGVFLHSKKHVLLENIIKSWVWEGDIDCDRVLDEMKMLNYSVVRGDLVYCSLIHIIEYKKDNNKLDHVLFGYSIENIMQELLADYQVVVICTYLERNLFSCMVVGSRESMPQVQELKRQLAKYIDVIFQLYGCATACFLGDMVEFSDAANNIRFLEQKRNSCKIIESKIYFQWKGDDDRGSLMPDVNKQDEYVEKIVHYIQCNIEKPLNRSDVASAVNLSENYLTHLFKQKMGISLKRFIINEKMIVAKNLLQSTNLPISTIAAEVGYDNFSHFSATYREVMGINPIKERY